LNRKVDFLKEEKYTMAVTEVEEKSTISRANRCCRAHIKLPPRLWRLEKGTGVTACYAEPKTARE
jgi:hypothetical protein